MTSSKNWCIQVLYSNWHSILQTFCRKCWCHKLGNTDRLNHSCCNRGGGSKKMCNWRSSSHIALTPDFIQTYNHINQAYELLKCRLYTFQFLDWLIDFSYLFWLFMFIMLLIVAWITRINAWKHGTFKQALLVHCGLGRGQPV